MHHIATDRSIAARRFGYSVSVRVDPRA
jgi:hypothetical protein